MKALLRRCPKAVLQIWRRSTSKSHSQPKDQVLVRVLAAGVTPTELLWYPSTHKKDGSDRAHAVPGHEFSGIVESVGSEDTGFVKGDAIFGMKDWFSEGATAEFCVTSEKDIVSKPASLSHTDAAAVPIAALTGWQGLVQHAQIRAGDRVRIVGAGGSVGLMAVQIAVMHGCRVVASASLSQTVILTELGCEQVLDYKTQAFEDHVNDIDVVFDAVGSDTLARAKKLVGEGGRMVTVAAEGSDDRLTKESFFIVVPSREQLTHIAQLIEQQRLRVFVKDVLTLSSAPKAYLHTGTAQTALGKLVLLDISDQADFLRRPSEQFSGPGTRCRIVAGHPHNERAEMLLSLGGGQRLGGNAKLPADRLGDRPVDNALLADRMVGLVAGATLQREAVDSRGIEPVHRRP